LLDEVLRQLREHAGKELGCSGSTAEPGTRCIGNRQAEVDRRTADVGGVVGADQLIEVGGAVTEIETAADAVDGVVGIGVGQLIELIGAAGIEREGDPLAGTEEVVLADAGIEDDALDCEKPMPAIRLPDGFSLTVTSTST
jgi:hypothetical protein